MDQLNFSFPINMVKKEQRIVSGIATEINKTTGDALDDASVNAIRIIQNSVRIYGGLS